MQAAVEAGAATADSDESLVISGESKLLDISDIASDMDRLRRMFSLFEKKTDLLQLLDVSSRAQGVQIYIGGDSQLVPLEDVSVITAPYGVDGTVVGTLGVIGPSRMARSEEHTSDIQSLMRISYAVLCVKKKKTIINKHNH